jgi:hypothetical protein
VISFTGGGNNCNDWTSTSTDLGGKGGWYGMSYLCGPLSYPPNSAEGLFTGPSCAAPAPFLCVDVPVGQVVGANFTVTSDASTYAADLVVLGLVSAYVLW